MILSWTAWESGYLEGMVNSNRVEPLASGLWPPDRSSRPRSFDPPLCIYVVRTELEKQQRLLRKTSERVGPIGHNAEKLVELCDHEHLEYLRLNISQPQLPILLFDLVIYVDQHTKRG